MDTLLLTVDSLDALIPEVVATCPELGTVPVDFREGAHACLMERMAEYEVEAERLAGIK